MTTAEQNICSNDDGDNDGMMRSMKNVIAWGENFFMMMLMAGA